MPIIQTGVQYHLYCESCGRKWWSPEGFQQYCPYCKTNRMPKEIQKMGEEHDRRCEDDTDN